METAGLDTKREHTSDKLQEDQDSLGASTPALGPWQIYMILWSTGSLVSLGLKTVWDTRGPLALQVNSSNVFLRSFYGFGAVVPQLIFPKGSIRKHAKRGHGT